MRLLHLIRLRGSLDGACRVLLHLLLLLLASHLLSFAELLGLA